MAELKAFKGFVYNKEKEDISKDITRPYDKISEKLKQEYYAKSEYNMVRLILGDSFSGDEEDNNKYIRASKYLKKWIADSVLVKDETPCLYIYDEEFDNPAGGRLSRTGVISMLRLEEFSKGIVLPHEKTLSKPKADRLELIKNCNMHFGQIFGLYRDEENIVENIIELEMKQEPYFDVVTEEENIRHRLWKIENEEIIEIIINEFKDKKVYIADGHHRYETGINYRNEMRELYPEKADTGLFNYIMMTLVNYQNKGLVVLPTHRVIQNYKEIDIDKFKEDLEPLFEIKEFSKEEYDEFLLELNKDNEEITLGVAIDKYDKYLLITLKDNSTVNEKLENIPESLQKLYVTVLHTLIIRDVLGITDKSVADESYIKYAATIEESLAMVEGGEAQIAFLLRSTKVSSVINSADDGQTMPQKSTDFYPKLYTGVTLSDFLDEVY
jgi:uncharacterized protein (DUF1015 family)